MNKDNNNAGNEEAITQKETYILMKPWELLVKAYHLRTPTHPLFPFIKSSAILNKRTGEFEKQQSPVQVDQKKQIPSLPLERIVEIDPGLPSFIAKFFGIAADSFEFFETTTIDWAKKCFIIQTKNKTLGTKCTLNEKCMYTSTSQQSNSPKTTKNIETSLTINIPMPGFLKRAATSALLNILTSRRTQSLEAEQQICDELMRMNSNAPQIEKITPIQFTRRQKFAASFKKFFCRQKK